MVKWFLAKWLWHNVTHPKVSYFWFYFNVLATDGHFKKILSTKTEYNYLQFRSTIHICRVSISNYNNRCIQCATSYAFA